MGGDITWNTANSSIAQTSNAIITVKDTLTGLGIEITDICNGEEILTAVNQMLKQWMEDVLRLVDSITFEMVGNFLTTLAALIGQIIAAAATSFTNLFLLEILAGNLLNSVVSAVVFALALLPGAEIILQYYLVSTLKRDLSRRAELGWILNKQFTMLIELLNSFYNLFEFEDDLAYSDLRLALNSIRKAESIIGREASKNFYGEEPVTLDNLGMADTHIDNAVNYLTHKNYSTIYSYIETINASYGITADVPEGFDVQGWIHYFDTLQPMIALKFFTYNAVPGTPEYENESTLKSQQYAQFVTAMMKIMPPVLQRIILNTTFKDASSIIYERIPVWANNLKILKDIKGFLDNTVTVPEKFLSTYLNINTTPPTPEPALFTNPATRDITWRDITAKIRIEEAGVLLLPSYWDYIKNVGGLLQNILLPTLGILKSVDEDIDGVLNDEQRMGIAELSVNQFKWIEQLTVARGFLATILNSTSISNQYGGFEIDPILVYNSTVEADVKMSQLKEFIKDKAFDSITNTSKIQAADVVYDIAQKYLGSLMANIYIIINPVVAKNTITGLQALRVAIGQQITQDNQEAALCSSFLSIVEANPLFIAAKPYLDQLLRDLEQTSIGSGIAKQILTGDVSGVIGILEGYHLANDAVNLINCENQDTGQNVDPSTLGLNPDVSVETMRKLNMALSAARDEQEMILESIPKIMEMMINPAFTGV